MFSDLIDDDDLLSEALVLSSPTLLKPIVNIGNSATSSVLLMQPKIEPQQIVFDPQQQQQQTPTPPPVLAPSSTQTKMVPIAPRYESPQSNTTNTNVYTCSNCTQPIHERYFLRTQDRLSSRGNYWHMQCLRCQCCDVVLADISSTFYTKDNILLCKSDYIKRYGSRPCSLCSQVIGTNEQIMRVSPNYVYHLSCFSCVKCHIALVKGDRYVLFNGQPFCEKDNPLKSTANMNNNPAPKRGATTAKRGAKAGRITAAATAAAAAAAVQAQQTFVTPPQYHHTGHVSLLNNPHNSSTITHSLLSNATTTSSNNGLSSILTPNGDDLY